MRGLNIQWPFSQLILMGAKLEEVREYALDYRGIAKTDEEVWSVETKGPCAKPSTNAVVTGIKIAAHTSSAQIVGTIRFASVQPYSNKQAFHEARDRHRIKVGPKFDWDGSGAVYGWRVGMVRALAEPIPVGTTGQTGFGVRSFSVVFVTTAAQRAPGDNVRAGEDDLRKSVVASPRGCPDGANSDRPLSNAIGSASDDQGGHASGGRLVWHARIEQYLGGPYVTPDACRQACSQMVVALSEAAGGCAEDSSHHLDQGSGWLSIDVINILGQGLFGFHVEGCSTLLDEWAMLGEGTALVNWNNQHWTVLTSHSCTRPWIHINSVFGGDESFHGRMETQEMSVVSVILIDIRRRYGGVSLYRIVRGTGHQLLEAVGMQAMLPPEEMLPLDAPEINAAVLSDEECSDTSITQGISLVTVNVDGLGEYPRSPTERRASILEEVLRTSPDFLLMQEVTTPMYMEAHRVLTDWKVKKNHDQTEEYFNVTATKWPAKAADRSTSFPSPSSNNGRHTLTVRRGEWAVINVHAEFGTHAVVDRDARAEQPRARRRQSTPSGW